jgi:hypothetical protein
VSTRIRTDGRRYDPTTDLDIRPWHKPVMPDPSLPDHPPLWKCAVCGEQWGYVSNRKTGVEYRRHFPGTFWERD